MSKNILHKSVIQGILFLGYLILLQGCSLQNVYYSPPPAAYAKIAEDFYNNGQPQHKQPWIVFSDRTNNRLNASIKEDPNVIYKESSFLEAFIVLNKTGNMFKVARYKPDLINDGKIPKAKALKIAGWIPEEHLLLWTNSLKNAGNGFASKSAIVVNHEDVIQAPQKFIENDSAIVFTNPDLLNKKVKKISLGSIVYIYKLSEDKKSVLIGRKQSISPDSIQHNMYGWVSQKMIKIWGERASVKLASDTLKIGLATAKDNYVLSYNAVSPKTLLQRSGLQSIYPSNHAKGWFKNVKFFTNVLDYDRNKIYNVLGKPIFYKRYREILLDNRKLNVIFVLDVSQNNRLYMPLAKSLLQELQLNFLNPSYFSSVKFGGVVYKQNTCDVSPLRSTLSNNYRDIALFFEEKINQLDCPDSDIVQPVDRSLLSAAQMLEGKENETNLIILIGTTGNQYTQSQSMINALTRVNAKMIFFQTQSKSADAYNDFVLLGEKSVVNSAKNIAERKKEKLVNQNDVLLNNNYSLTTGENGKYYLDYPTQSMTQGFVIFPKKGETMQAGILKSAIDTLLTQTAHDNMQIDSTLTQYFRSEIGVNNTKIAEPYSQLFPMVGKSIPNATASSLLNQNNTFLIDGVFTGAQDSLVQITKPGILLNELEYDQLWRFYTQVYKAVFSKEHFNKENALETYVKIISENIATLSDLQVGELKTIPVRELIKITTDFRINSNALMDLTPQEWSRNKTIKSETVLKYFEQFREIAVKMGLSKSEKAIRIEHEGQGFYWLGEDFIPMIR